MRRPGLAPLVPLYAAGLAAREWTLRVGWEQKKRLRCPVVSVGSISAGGAGKTPLTIALARLLTANGIATDVLSRGFGRKTEQALAVDPDGEAEIFGDEPLLIARHTAVPVFVAKQRWMAGELAERRAGDGCTVHLLDDGFQHRQLERALDVVLVGGEDLRDHLLPAGNLREPKSALHRAEVLAVREEDEVALAWLKEHPCDGGAWRYRRVMQWPHEMPQPVVAFCGIAKPEQFLEGLRSGGIAIQRELIFRDHQPYSHTQILQLRRAMLDTGTRAFMTTAKDMARLGRAAEELRQIAPVFCAELEVIFSDPAAIIQRIQKLLAAWNG